MSVAFPWYDRHDIGYNFNLKDDDKELNVDLFLSTNHFI